MKGILYSSFFMVLAFVSCAKAKIIPDEKLAQIFHDIYLTNAYASTYGMGNADSVSIYEPVFARHGYTSRDIQYTIGNFAKRKSARVGDVVDRAIAMLANENQFFAGRIAIQDTLALIARERYSTPVRSDSLIRITRIRDTARLRFNIPVEAGGYTVDYDYFLDSADHNANLAFRHYILTDENRHTQNNLRRPKTLANEHISISFVTSPTDKTLVVNLNGYPQKDMTTPRLTIRNLAIKRHPDRQTALDSMARSLFEGLYKY